LLATLLLARPSDVAATQKFGPLEISGNLQTENLVRMPDPSTYQFIMNRNIGHLQLEYAWLEGGKLMNNYDIPFIQSSKLIINYRGVYDSVYDTTPGFAPQVDIHGRAYSGLNIKGYRCA